jgi:predicted RNA-binding Zn ribbon-like protein
MTQNVRPAPFFLADDRALDFLNSIASPWGKEIEWIGDGYDLLAWLEFSALVPSSAVTQFRKEAGKEELDAVAAQASELREWFRTFVGDHAGRSLQSTALDALTPINRLLARDNCYRQIEEGNLPHPDKDMPTTALRWRQERRWRSLDDLLLPIAEVMGNIVCRVDFELVKKCESPTCTLWFHDVSQNHTRRWCSMAVCGNRAKAAAHRARKRSARHP